MKRLSFLGVTAAAGLSGALPRSALGRVDSFDPRPGAWRTFEVTTTVILRPGDEAQAWIPIGGFRENDWMKPASNTFEGNAAEAKTVTASGAQMVYARWSRSSSERRLTVRSTVSTNDLAVDFAHRSPVTLSESERAYYLAPTKYIPTTGIVLETAQKITAGARDDRDKVQRIYDWIVANTYRNPKTRGCGLGDISFLLETGDLGGKCADLNGLAVGLARASGIPARDLYGIRVAPSRFGYKSLGANSIDITHAQHCRAEVFLADYGWVPVDPADVRKVILEEPPGHLSATDAKVANARETLFGAWEGNYVAFNDAHDLALPGTSGDTLPFLMYPQAEIAGERLDSLDPADFTYTITAVSS